MRKPAIIVIVLLVIAFALITILRRSDDESPATDSRGERFSSEQRDRIAGFWSVYGHAEKLQNAGDRIGAVQQYSEALRLDSTHETAYYRLGNLFIELGRYDEAVTTFEKLIQINPMSARARQRLGYIYSSPFPGRSRDLDSARIFFEDIMRLNAEESGPYYWLGRVLIQLGRIEKGRDYLRTATRLNPAYVEAFSLLAYSYLADSMFSEAAAYYTRALHAGVKKAKPGELPGEGDTKASLKDASATGSRNIASLFGLAVASRAMGGYADTVPDDFRTRFPDRQKYLRRSRISHGGGFPTSWMGTSSTVLTRSADFNQDGQSDKLEVGFTVDTDLDIRLYIGSESGFEPANTQHVTGEGYPVDCEVGDYNGDSFPDLFMLMFPARGRLYRNHGGKRFEDVTDQAQLSIDFPSLDAVFRDFNRDGKLDLFVSGLAPYDETLRSVLGVTPQSHDGRPILFLNEDGVFKRIDGAIANCFGTLAATAIDANGDDYPDIYLCNGGLEPGRFEPDALLVNRDGKSFECVYMESRPRKSLTAAVTGIAADGQTELMVTRGDFFSEQSTDLITYTTQHE